MKHLLKNKLFSNTIIFSISAILTKGLNFFILPIMTYYLTKEDYGTLGLIGSIVVISTIYIGLWPSNFLIVKFSAYGKEKIAKYMSNIFVILAVTFILILLSFHIFSSILFSAFDNKLLLIYLVSFYSLFIVIFNTFNTIVQLEKDATKYAIFQFLYVFSSVAIALLLIIQFDFGWKGKIYAELFVLLLISFYAIRYLFKKNYITLNYDNNKIKELLAYLFPMTFHIVGLFAMGTIDKVFLSHYINLEAVGIYTIAMSMSIVVNIIYDSFLKAIEPYLYEKLNSGSDKDMRFVVKIVLLYSVSVVLISALYIFTIPYLFSIMIDDKFKDALLYIPLLVVGFSLEGLRKPIATFLMHNNKVKTLGTITFIAAIINIILNIILIQTYGIAGAAYATIGSFLFLYISTVYLMQKNCNINWTNLSKGKHLCQKTPE